MSNLLEFGGGALLVLVILFDIFVTIIIPSRISAGPRTATLMRRLLLPIWRRAATLVGDRYTHGVLSVFPGFLLVATFLIWLLLLLIGLSMMAHALAAEFTPRLQGFAEAMFQIGSAMMTLGLSGHTASGASRAVLVLAGVCGLQVVTLTLTYILQIQSALQRRDAMALQLSARAGNPPSGVVLLATTAELGLSGKFAGFFEQWDGWAANLIHAYRSRPVLVYFQSDDRAGNWLAALNAVLDAAALLTLFDEAGKGEAELFRRTATALLNDLHQVLGIPAAEPQIPAPSRLEEDVHRLRKSGLRQAEPHDTELVMPVRRDHQALVRSIAEHLNLPVPHDP